MTKHIALDFDGTTFTDPQSNYLAIGEPKWDVINAIKKEIEAGAEVYLWTLRSGQALQDAFEALQKVGLNIKNYIANKPNVDEFWDDRLRHPNDF